MPRMGRLRASAGTGTDREPNKRRTTFSSKTTVPLASRDIGKLPRRL